LLGVCQRFTGPARRDSASATSRHCLRLLGQSTIDRSYCWHLCQLTIHFQIISTIQSLFTVPQDLFNPPNPLLSPPLPSRPHPLHLHTLILKSPHRNIKMRTPVLLARHLIIIPRIKEAQVRPTSPTEHSMCII